MHSKHFEFFSSVSRAPTTDDTQLFSDDESTNADSNDSFSYRAFFEHKPKSAALFKSHRSTPYGPSAVRTYWGPPHLFDEQKLFNMYITSWNTKYDLDNVWHGQPVKKNVKIIESQFEKILRTIQFRVFCYEYHKEYVGADNDITMTEQLAISQISKSICSIRMYYRDPV